MAKTSKTAEKTKDSEQYWLVKSEPDSYSWDQFKKDKSTAWTGIRNYAARIHLRTMKKGDKVLFYHSNKGLEILGFASVIKEAYQDPTIDDDAWVAVDLKFEKEFKKPVSLSTIKNEKSLANMALIRISRLSVQPVTSDEWNRIVKLSDEG